MASIASAASHDKDASANTRFRFLGLPIELRRDIYFKVIGLHNTYLFSNNLGKLAHGSAMPRVCRLIRQEFLGVLYSSVDIHTRVVNFNFAHIVTFFNRLQEDELKTMSSSESGSNRRMEVELDFPTTNDQRRNLESYFVRLEGHLTRWLNRIEHPTKKGVDVDITYQPVHCCKATAETWVNWLKKQRKAAKGNKKRNELNKMIEALEAST